MHTYKVKPRHRRSPAITSALTERSQLGRHVVRASCLADEVEKRRPFVPRQQATKSDETEAGGEHEEGKGTDDRDRVRCGFDKAEQVDDDDRTEPKRQEDCHNVATTKCYSKFGSPETGTTSNHRHGCEAVTQPFRASPEDDRVATRQLAANEAFGRPESETGARRCDEECLAFVRRAGRFESVGFPPPRVDPVADADGGNGSPELSSTPVKLSDTQSGRIGEYLLSVYAMITTNGVLVPFHVEADDDHRDIVVSPKGSSAYVSIQAKACFQLGAAGFVQSNATYFESSIPKEPSWVYVVVLVLDLAPVCWWLVPAPDFNRLTSHAPARGGRKVELHFRAHPDKTDAFTPFRIQTKDVGPRLMQIIEALPANTKPLPGARLLVTRR